MNKIRKGDEVVVITGKDKGRRGTVTQVLATGKLVVEGINVAKKHQKPNPNVGVSGGIVEKEMPIELSNVMLWNGKKEKGDRVGFKLVAGKDGKQRKVRVFKSNGESVDA
jgi:large subunit ribosomal protein L24